MKRSLIAVLGGSVTIVGVVLLVLPGPGFVLVAAGLAILGTQFEWAKRPLVYATGKADQGLAQVGRSRLQAAFALVCGLVLVVAGVLAVAGVDIPYVSALSGVLLVASGLFLVGTLVYARSSRGRARAARVHPG